MFNNFLRTTFSCVFRCCRIGTPLTRDWGKFVQSLPEVSEQQKLNIYWWLAGWLVGWLASVATGALIMAEYARVQFFTIINSNTNDTTRHYQWCCFCGGRGIEREKHGQMCDFIRHAKSPTIQSSNDVQRDKLCDRDNDKTRSSRRHPPHRAELIK